MSTEMFFRRSLATRKLMLLLMSAEFGPKLTGPEAESLIRKGVMVNALLPGRDTLLSLASIWGNRDVARALVHYGADVNGYKYGGSVPLVIAAQNAHLELIRFLAAKGADLDRQNNVGETALHAAMADRPREFRTAALLISLGANPRVRNSCGQLPSDVLASYLEVTLRGSAQRDEHELARRVTSMWADYWELRGIESRS